MRYESWKVGFKAQENTGLKVWQREFTDLRIPQVYQIRRTCSNAALSRSNTVQGVSDPSEAGELQLGPGDGLAFERSETLRCRRAYRLLRLKTAMAAWIIGQDAMVGRLLLGLLAEGHLLVEGFPAVAKTRAIKALPKHLDAKRSRIQFTPDLCQRDLTGCEIYDASSGDGAMALVSAVEVETLRRRG
jgi:hypothetical protein